MQWTPRQISTVKTPSMREMMQIHRCHRMTSCVGGARKAANVSAKNSERGRPVKLRAWSTRMLPGKSSPTQAGVWAYRARG